MTAIDGNPPSHDQIPDGGLPGPDPAEEPAAPDVLLAEGSDTLLVPAHARFCRCEACATRRSRPFEVGGPRMDRMFVVAVLLLAVSVLVDVLLGGPLLK